GAGAGQLRCGRPGGRPPAVRRARTGGDPRARQARVRVLRREERLRPRREQRAHLMKVLVTGAAGRIGFHRAQRLLARGDTVVGLDVVNDYYDPSLKEARLGVLAQTPGAAEGRWSFLRADLADEAAVRAAFAEHRFERVIHLAAQAGVRHSLTHPHD